MWFLFPIYLPIVGGSLLHFQYHKAIKYFSTWLKSAKFLLLSIKFMLNIINNTMLSSAILMRNLFIHQCMLC